MSVTASELIGVDASATQDQLWAQCAYLMANWQGGLEVRSSWTTIIERARNGGETRTGIATKPGRSFSATIRAMDLNDSIRLASIVRRMTSARTPMPIHADAGDLLAGVGIGATELEVKDVRLRRFKIGARALIAKREEGARARYSDYELVTVSGIDEEADTLTISATTKAWPAWADVIPIVEAHITRTGRAKIITGNCSDAGIEFDEVEGASALDPLCAAGGEAPEILSDVEMLDGIPIWPFQIDWSGGIEEGIERAGTDGASGTASVTDLWGGGPLLNFGLDLTFIERLEAWRFLTFFDWRRGRLHPFLHPNPSMRLPTPSTIGTSDITFPRGLLPDGDWGWVKYLAVIKSDLSAVLRRVTDVDHDGAETTLAIDGDWGVLTIVDVAWATAGHLCRFGSDEVVEDWDTGEIMTARAQVHELVAEEEIEIEDLETPATGTEYDP